MGSRRTRRRRVLVAAIAMAMLLPPTAGRADAPPDETDPYPGHDVELSIAFPTLAETWFRDDYHAPRGGGTRVHMAIDLMGEQMWPLYAAVDGRVCALNGVGEPPPTWGFSLTICAEDGRRYRYIHVNDDTPGTSDMSGLHQFAYAPAVYRGATVRRGQLVAYMGDSGNAKGGTPHLHFEIFDDEVEGPYGENRINPYRSLVAALERGEVPDGRVPLDAACPDLVVATSFTDVADSLFAESIACVSSWQVALGRGDGSFGPDDPLSRGQMASFLTRILQTSGVEPPDDPDREVVDFVDITGHAHESAIGLIAAYGIAEGYADGTFRPNDPLTRGQITSFAVRTYELIADRELPERRDAFLDDDGGVHERAINAAANANLVDGLAPGRFGPGRTVTREVMADLLARLLDRLAAAELVTR